MIWSEKFSSRKWDGVHEMFRIQKKIYHMMILSLYQKKERQKAPDDTTLSKFRYSSGYLSEIFDFFQANKKFFCMRKIRVVWHFSLLFLALMPLKKRLLWICFAFFDGILLHAFSVFIAQVLTKLVKSRFSNSSMIIFFYFLWREMHENKSKLFQRKVEQA